MPLARFASGMPMGAKRSFKSAMGDAAWRRRRTSTRPKKHRRGALLDAGPAAEWTCAHSGAGADAAKAAGPRGGAVPQARHRRPRPDRAPACCRGGGGGGTGGALDRVRHVAGGPKVAPMPRRCGPHLLKQPWPGCESGGGSPSRAVAGMGDAVVGFRAVRGVAAGVDIRPSRPIEE